MTDPTPPEISCFRYRAERARSVGMESVTRVLRAAAIRDAAGRSARPGAVAVRGGRIVAAGSPQEVDVALDGTAHENEELRDTLLLPALVNTHAHLDLTSIGPVPYHGTFVAWAEAVMRERPQSDDAVRTAVNEGLRLSREAGVGWLGDVAGDEGAIRARAATDAAVSIPGTSWLECFGLGVRGKRAADRAGERLTALRADPTVATADLTIELQPHAPYSAGPDVYARAAAAGRPSTHLAETREELAFVADAAGPFADLLRRIDRWDDSIHGSRTSPVQALADVLASAPWLLAHCNYLEPEDIELLAATDVSVAYCPLASDYFGHRRHPYRTLLDAGINVCLGTDSILCQPSDEPQPLGIWPQMRHLRARDRTDPTVLLAMATVNGAKALGLDALAATLAPGAPARLTAVSIDPDDARDALEQALAGAATLRAVTS